MPKSADFWNERFAGSEYFYGNQPNAFIEEATHTWLSPKRDVLALGAGEGRNAVYLAREGHSVTAVDYSVEGLQKTKRLADAAGVGVDTIEADVREWSPGRQWDVVVVTFLHLAPEEKPLLYRRIQSLLRPGGVLIAEWFRPEQRTEGYDSGGPPDPAMMMTADELRENFAEAGIEVLDRAEPTLDEGMHAGPAATIRFVWRQPEGAA